MRHLPPDVARARALLWIGVTLTLLAPSAHAAPADGTFLVEGVIKLPESTLVEMSPLAAFTGGSRQADPPMDFTVFLIRADSMVLTEYRENAPAAKLPAGDRPAGLQGSREPSAPMTLTNVSITLEGPLQKGYVAIEPDRAPARASVLSTQGLSLGSVDRSEMSDSDSTGETSPTQQAYTRILDAPHALAVSPGRLEWRGAAQMKLSGMTLVVSHDGGRERIETGTKYTSSTPDGMQASVGVFTMSWVILNSSHLEFEAVSGRPWLLAGHEVVLDWQGAARFTAVSGALETPQAVYGFREDRRDTSTLLEGEFRGNLRTVREEGVQSAMTVSGDLAHTDLPVTQTKGLRGVAPGTGQDWLFLGLLIGTVLGGAGGVVVLRRRQAARRAVPVPVSPAISATSPDSAAHGAEYLMSMAEQCIQFEDHAKALHWLTLAREASPTSANIVTTMAYVLGELGHFEEALEAYAEASRLSPGDGEADLNAARLAVRAGRAPEFVEGLVVRALERSPEFVFDVEEDEEFLPLADRPGFRHAVGLAWERWGDEDLP